MTDIEYLHKYIIEYCERSYQSKKREKEILASQLSEIKKEKTQ